MVKMITQKELKSLLLYDASTGEFFNLTNRYHAKKGQVAGYTNNTGYTSIAIKRKQYLAHRLAWLYVYGGWPDQIDHINHNRKDNRISNLRNVNHQENAKNRSAGKNNSSGITGVDWRTRDKEWRARIKFNRRLIHLGTSKDKFEAICLRKSAESALGFHGNHGK